MLARPLVRCLAAVSLLAAWLPQSATAQLPQTRLPAIHPSGAQRGTSVDVTLAGGTDLDEAIQLYFSHPGITATPKTQMVDGKPEPVAGQFTVTVAPEVPVGVFDVRVRALYGMSNPRT